MVTAYDQRRRYLVHELREMGIDCFEPFGAFYIFPSIKKFGMTSEEFANRLLEDQKLAVVPGTAFGESGEEMCIRDRAGTVPELEENGEFLKEDNYIPDFRDDGIKTIENIILYERKAPHMFKAYDTMGIKQLIQVVVCVDLSLIHI